MLLKRLRSIAVLLVISLSFMPVHGYCLPQGEQVVEGSATFDRATANTLTVNQATDKMVANYNSFSIAQPEAVHFIQPSSSSIALNRVVGVDPSLIMGTLTANGRIFLINPNGVTFGAGSRVDTMGLVASTLNLANDDFMAGRYSFVGNGGSVVNLGYLSAPGGYVALLGSRVENQGIIEAQLGSVALASGKAVTLQLDPKGVISVVIDEAAISNADNKDDAVKNSGTIKANGGKVLLTAKALDGVFKNAVNTDGIIEANSIGDVMGEVSVEANQRVAIGGTINAKGGIVRVDCQGADFTGAINAKLGNFNMNDGDTFIAGDYVGGYTVTDNLHINVSGDTTVDGDLNVHADFDNNGSGDLSITDATLIVTDGDISLTGVNISIVDSLIKATKNFGETVNVSIEASNNLSIAGVGGEEAETIRAEVYGPGNAYVTLNAGTVEGKEPSALTITDAKVTALIHGDGAAHVDITNENGPVSIKGSQILARIGAGSSTAQVDISSADDLSIDASAIQAIVDYSGTAKVYLNPHDGGITLSNGSEVSAQVGADGFAGVYMYNYDLENIISFIFTGMGIDLGGPIGGDISISGDSHVFAQGSSESGDTALVYMNTDGNIDLSGSSTIEAYQSYGTALAALVAGADINMDAASSIEASSQGSNALVDLINTYIFGLDDPTQRISIESAYNFSSNALLFSLMGNINLGNVSADTVAAVALGMGGDGTGSIFDVGMVNATYLAMLAAGDIGTADAPIQTDVDIVSAASYGLGDIYINQNNVQRPLELGLYLPLVVEEWVDYSEGGEWEVYDDQVEFGASVAANNGIVHITTEGDMIVNSVISANGGVFLESKQGNIYAGYGWNPVVSEDTVTTTAEILGAFVDFSFGADDGEETETAETIADFMKSFLMVNTLKGVEEEENEYLSPFRLDFPLDRSANVWATGYSYFSTPEGKIGVELYDDADLQGAVAGLVRPGVSGALSPRPGFDLLPESGYVTYDDDVDGDLIQIWPDPAVTPFKIGDSANPLYVNIQLRDGSKSAAPVRGDEYEQPFSPVAGLTLNYGIPTLKPVEPPKLDATSQLTGPLARNIRAYYEILSLHRFVSNEPATPSTFFGYRPLTPTNMAAFDEMNLDIGAYDFISDNIKTKKPLSPYYGL